MNCNRHFPYHECSHVGSSWPGATDSVTDRNAVFIEFCAGSGNLSSAMREAGFTTYSIDHEHNRHQPKIALILSDLTQEHSQQTALDMVRQLRPIGIHLGLPCGNLFTCKGSPIAGAPAGSTQCTTTFEVSRALDGSTSSYWHQLSKGSSGQQALQFRSAATFSLLPAQHFGVNWKSF